MIHKELSDHINIVDKIKKACLNNNYNPFQKPSPLDLVSPGGGGAISPSFDWSAYGWGAVVANDGGYAATGLKKKRTIN